MYLNNYWELGEILNFFEETITGRIFLDRPHRPIGRPNWPNRPFFDELVKNREKHDPKSSCHTMVENGQKYSKKFLVNLSTLLFSKKNFFSKKVAQLQKYQFWTKFDQILTIFHQLSSDPQIIS